MGLPVLSHERYSRTNNPKQPTSHLSLAPFAYAELDVELERFLLNIEVKIFEVIATAKLYRNSIVGCYVFLPLLS